MKDYFQLRKFLGELETIYEFFAEFLDEIETLGYS